MNVVLYMRYSSDAQTEQSIEGQDRVCTEFCKREGYNIIHKYIDRATSAAKDIDKRVQFLRMIEDAASGSFQAVVVYKLDRFSRNRYDSAVYKSRLKKAGVQVISATENISNSPEGVILESVLEGIAEYYSMELAQKIRRGQVESMSKGNYLGGIVPLGYKIVDKKYVIDPETAPVAQEIFRRYSSGERTIDIIDSLNRRGFRTARGSMFNRSSFHKMLKSEIYIGILRRGDLVNSGAVPALIEESVFYAARNRAESQKRGKKMKKTEQNGCEYKLSGKLYCGECGEVMHGKCATSKTGQKHYYYECRGNYANKGCKKSRVRKDWLEDCVLDLVKEIITPEVIDQLADAAVEQNQKDIDDNTSIELLRKSLSAAKNKMNNLIRISESGADPDYIVPRINSLSAEIKELEANLAEQEAFIIEITKEQCVYFLTQFLSGKIDNPGFRDHVFDILVKKITIWEKAENQCKIAIELNVINETHALVGVGSHNVGRMEHRGLYANFLGLSFTFIAFIDVRRKIS
jgi:DNA invertase Pin-like site-specific DNA recombinase